MNEQFTTQINRLEEYLEVVGQSQNTEAVLGLGVSITQTASNILATSPENSIVNEVYDLVENLESVLLCNLECGNAPQEILV